MGMLGDFRLLPSDVLAQLIASPAVALDFLYGEEVTAGDRMNVGKAWHGIHFLLCGAAFEGEPPLDFIVRGGFELGHDGGYGPARAYQPAQLKQISAALGPFIPGVLRKRFNVDALLEAQIYPHTWEAGEREDLIDTFAQLKRFLADGASRGLGLVVCVRAAAISSS